MKAGEIGPDDAGSFGPALRPGSLRNSSGTTAYEVWFRHLEDLDASLTPTAFNSLHHPFLFPLPESAAGSWLRRWQAFTSEPHWLPFSEAEFKEAVRQHLTVEKFTLRTTSVHLRQQTFPGCQGQITDSAHTMPLTLHQALDAFIEYAHFCGSGYKTTQGWGQTRLLQRE